MLSFRKPLAKSVALFFGIGLTVSLSGCSSLFYQPDSYLYLDPKKVGYNFDEIKFDAQDQTHLLGWFFRAKKQPLGTIVLFHGNAQNLSSHFSSLIWATEDHYNLFVFSYRGYGGSEGEPSQEGTVLDGIAALKQADQLRNQNGGGSLIVIGQSLGGAVAMRSVSEWGDRDRIQGLVLDSTFMSYPRVARRVLAERWWLWPFSPIAHVLVSNAKGTEQAVRENRIPLLVIHDLRDPVVTFPNGQEIFDTAHDPKEFWKLDQGLHVGAFSDPRSPERPRLLEWLGRLTPSQPLLPIRSK